MAGEGCYRSWHFGTACVEMPDEGTFLEKVAPEIDQQSQCPGERVLFGFRASEGAASDVLRLQIEGSSSRTRAYVRIDKDELGLLPYRYRGERLEWPSHTCRS